MIQTATLRFLQELAAHNTREWFEANRKLYEAAKADFAAFIATILQQHAHKDAALQGLEAKDCTFRINRDVRFSKDKSPYKTNFGASLARGGKKSIYAGYYFHLEPGKSFAGGGLWMPEAVNLKKIRQEIDYNWEEFAAIIRNKKFVQVFGKLSEEAEYKLSRPPKDYEAGNPAIEYLKLKSFIALVDLPDADLTGPSLMKTLAAFEALQPLLDFLNRALDEAGS
jgi:uncharacterized protein (TIGR02453 family)